MVQENAIALPLLIQVDFEVFGKVQGKSDSGFLQ